MPGVAGRVGKMTKTPFFTSIKQTEFIEFFRTSLKTNTLTYHGTK